MKQCVLLYLVHLDCVRWLLCNNLQINVNQCSEQSLKDKKMLHSAVFF